MAPGASPTAAQTVGGSPACAPGEQAHHAIKASVTEMAAPSLAVQAPVSQRSSVGPGVTRLCCGGGHLRLCLPGLLGEMRQGARPPELLLCRLFAPLPPGPLLPAQRGARRPLPRLSPHLGAPGTPGTPGGQRVLGEGCCPQGWRPLHQPRDPRRQVISRVQSPCLGSACPSLRGREASVSKAMGCGGDRAGDRGQSRAVGAHGTGKQSSVFSTDSF